MITLRAGYGMCTTHTMEPTIRSRVRNMTKSRNTTFNFYDIEVTTNEIHQLTAVTNTGDHLNLVVQESMRKNNSPITE